MTVISTSTLAGNNGRFPLPPPSLTPATDPATHLQYLTSIRNAVIGSKTKKTALAQHGDISYFVTLLNSPLQYAHALEIRSQAATILGSIAHGASVPTLLVLLQAQTPQQLLRTLTELLTTTTTSPSSSSSQTNLLLTSPSPTPLKTLESVIRALRVLMLTVADELCASPRWGLGSGWGSKGGAASTSNVPAGARLRSFSTASVLSSSSSSSAFGLSHDPSASSDEAERMVRILGRRAVAHVLGRGNVERLLAPLMLVPSSQTTSSGGTSMILSADPAGPSSTAGPGNHLFPSSTKVRLNNITEMICSLLSACLAIPGPGPETSSHASSSSSHHHPISPEAELLERRTSMLAYRAHMAPWNHQEEEEDDERISRAAFPSSKEGMQAELLHSPSRSGSLDRQRRQGRATRGMYGSGSGEAEMDGGEDDGIPGAVLRSRPDDVGLLDVLIEAVEGSLAKTREAALWTMAELVRDCPSAAERVILCQTASGEQPTTMILRFREDPDVDIRLAAFCCMSNIVKVHNFGSNTSEYVLAALIELLDPTAPPMSVTGIVSSPLAASSSTTLPPVSTSTSAAATRANLDNIRTQLLGGGRISSTAEPHRPSTTLAPMIPLPKNLGTPREIDVQVQACFALSRLLSDEVELQVVGQDRFGVVRRVGGLVDVAWREIRRRLGEVGGGGEGVGLVQQAPMLVAGSGGRLLQSSAPVPALSESVVRLLEAALTVLATVSFHVDEIRQAIIDSTTPHLLPIITPSLTSPSLGIRIASTRLVRALSRSVATLRTSLVDAGVGEKLMVLLHDEGEVHEVRLEVVAALCNMVLKHSPMHEVLVAGGGVQRLVSFLDGEEVESSDSTGTGTTTTRRVVDGAMVINVLWALKNIVCRATLEVKTSVGTCLGWDRLYTLSLDADPLIQEQALNVIRNLAAVDEVDIEMTVQKIGLERLLDLLEQVIWERSGGRGAVWGSRGEDGSVLVLVQAAHVLVNLATGNRGVRMAVLQRANLLDAILFFMNHPKEEIRVAGVWCASNLTYRLQPAYGHGERADPTDDDVGIEAVKRLRAFDIELRIRDLLQKEEALNVRDRAKVLLTTFEDAT
ncbi:hypothetical protein A4X13_0g6026 [Tilletia indica]|uniref:Armadillo repeat-containing protein 8 n=1 Tax=Tilletia indica TaxID=43049 RepID=A0A8T8SPZ1_9BASI|nr:hypothetical protein A4X13_0g6026 [Tilletia indica]